MAKKSGSRLAYRESGTQNRKQNAFPDEITLRDEILELKRQVMILKRTNEQYSVKLRKYEDEAKRKDKQLEQLMDPRKNSDITKVLSTKGAAILMNLKDQNNALIQMILNKDLHIRRLMAEIKMSKLYASTKKNEGYRAEISRLRNLLIKSQETLKENVDFHEQSRSICVSGNSFLEFSSSSDQSSPRDLDELRLTILSLESHIQQSNDLLTKKNHEIALLREEVNFLKRFSRHKVLKNKPYNYEQTQCNDYEFSTPGYIPKQPDIFAPTKILDLFEKNLNQEDENTTRDSSKRWSSSIDSIQKYNFHSYISEETKELIETNQENNERVNKDCSLMGKSLFHHLAADEIKREKKIHSNLKSTVHAKEKWKKALNKYKELKQLNPQMFPGSLQVQEFYVKYENKKTEFLEEETEIQTTTAITYHSPTDNTKDKIDDFNSSELFIKEIDNKPESPSSSHSCDNDVTDTCQSSGKESWIIKDENNETYVSEEERPTGEVQQREPQIPENSPKSNNADVTQNSGKIEDLESNCTEPPRENYFHSSDSSFDSDYGYSAKQEVQQVQVEVQINSVASQSDSDQSENNISENNEFREYERENNENFAPELDFNDDDDVVIREK